MGTGGGQTPVNPPNNPPGTPQDIPPVNRDGPTRDPIYVTVDGVQEELKAYSADRDTLYDYFVSECTRLRSATTLYDASFRNAQGHLLQARNGWKYVEIMDSNGNVTGTRPLTIAECASDKLYKRQAACDNPSVTYANRDHVCPTNRNW